MRVMVAVALAALLFALAPPALGANFGAHAGLADDVRGDPYFRAGALLADVDHFLLPEEPQTDGPAFTLALAERAKPLSRNAWRFTTGWYEHLDQDARFVESRARISGAFPSYTDTDVRLAFDYLTITKHPFPETYDWILADQEILALVRDGLVAADLASVRAAVDDLLHSTDLNNPGLALQLNAARTYGAVYPGRVTDMEAEYDAYYATVTASYVRIFPRIDLELRSMAVTVRREAEDPGKLLRLLDTAMALEAMRPANWTDQEIATLAVLAELVPLARMSFWAALSLQERAWWISGYLER